MTAARDSFDVLVVGGGHAGAEAAAAAARPGARTGLVTLDPAAVGRMSCNPAIGGIGKGQLAREIDALGGLMGRAADRAGIQFRLLNTSKGRAVQSPRAQCDRAAYETAVRELLAEQGGVEIVAGEAVELLLETGPGDPRRVAGLVLADGRRLRAGAVVLTTGTFLEGVLHSGLEQQPGGRVGEGAATPLGEALRRLGLPTGRLKTGTPPRLAADSVDLGACQEQPGDPEPVLFSFLGGRPRLPQRSCWLTRTTPRTHEIVRANLDRAPMYAGRIRGAGPRYCPSLEDKVVRFADREAHVVFLEPEGVDSPLLYANGISTSLPAAVQQEFVRTIPGLERARIVQPGYAVEYTFVRPRALRRSLAVRGLDGLWLAGQICGTSGYEEAAGQGLLAGLNAALWLDGREPFVLGRHEAYLGVMVDDLVVSDPAEPYRMFTSRAEHRLLLRHDTADRRLTPRGAAIGAVGEERLARLWAKEERLARARAELAARSDPAAAPGGRRSLLDLLRSQRPDALARVRAAAPDLDRLLAGGEEWATLEADVRYEGYLARQEAWVARAAEREAAVLPENFDFAAVRGLRREAVECLERFRPETLGHAGRLAGVSPADLALLEVALRAGARPTG
ncbi:MAG: tRNA uridine-5-carboxymethylaminomethyl(34) synthesis enzyme MnmG [Planctomycetota bacterium]|nr:MAG: tRNA uridine-5-carboxymethylaminomethyl(34) synthesis enzyme MnmG [Planctomycetota bacterium]